ncbi:MAG: hypothetical protein HY926_09290 [Elusimicrobia bacterium]|nr:hypothetical protein [Elusimicrobiota bacterium]
MRQSFARQAVFLMAALLSLSGSAMAGQAAPTPPMPASPIPEACQKDLSQHCPPGCPAPRQCLADSWGRLSAPCRSAMSDDPLNPCRDLIRAKCFALSPDAILRECILAHLSEAAPACAQHIERKMSQNPCYAFRQLCKGSSFFGKESVHCFYQHIDDISFACLKKIGGSPHQEDLCAPDMLRFCPKEHKEERKYSGMATSEAKNARQKARDCLEQHMDELRSQACRQILRRLQAFSAMEVACAEEVPALCKEAPRNAHLDCLHKQEAKVSLKCRLKLRAVGR